MTQEIEVQEKLKSDVGALYEMELNNYFMTRTIKALNVTIGKCGHPQKPIAPTKQRMVWLYEATGGWGGVGLAVGFGIGLCARAVMAGCIIGLLMGMLIGYIIDMTKKTNAQAEADAEYEDALNLYRIKVANEKRRLLFENKYKDVLTADRDALVEKKKESEALLVAMYDTVGIDARYRGLVAIGHMNEYIRLGIANKLGGVDGLYYIVEQKMDKDLLRLTVEEISEKLDIIIDKLSQISYELQEMNQKFDSLLKKTDQAIKVGVENGKTLEEIRDNTGVSAYNSERMRREYEFRNMVGWN